MQFDIVFSLAQQAMNTAHQKSRSINLLLHYRCSFLQKILIPNARKSLKKSCFKNAVEILLNINIYYFKQKGRPTKLDIYIICKKAPTRWLWYTLHDYQPCFMPPHNKKHWNITWIILPCVEL